MSSHSLLKRNRLEFPAFWEASWTGLLDRRSLTWEPHTLKHAQLPAAKLPPLSDYDEPVAGLAPRYAKKWPELKTV